MEQSGGTKSLCSTLERLLAWEKKLYQEVKAREGVKIEHERKLSALQTQEYRGEEEAKLDKTKASIKRLQSLIVVTSQAVSTTSFAIVGLRDSDLIPQLIELCHGFMYMWRSMNQFHTLQNDVVQQVQGLVNHTTKSESTSDLHRQATRDLEAAVSTWHSSFCHLIKFQRDFVRSLHGWFKLTLHMSQWLKPHTANENVGENVHFGRTPGDRPILGMVAAHWNEEEASHISPKWCGGNGIPNSTTKYKEDQKVSWHATPFEERLEKALSEDNFISQRFQRGSPWLC